ncbi:MAG TPA: hypothetical protein VFE37_16305 [Chloroflexota bacterium]|nr:hypothetical protein [Chloroflexota bacterium]
MAVEPKPIKITPSVRLADLLAQADRAPVVLEKNGVRYRLSREDEEQGTDVSPEEYQAILNETIGSWADLDTDALIEQVYRWRAEGSRPADRPSWPT